MIKSCMVKNIAGRYLLSMYAAMVMGMMTTPAVSALLR